MAEGWVSISESVPPATMTVTLLKAPVNAFDAIDLCIEQIKMLRDVYNHVRLSLILHQLLFQLGVGGKVSHIIPCHLDYLCLILRTEF